MKFHLIALFIFLSLTKANAEGYCPVFGSFNTCESGDVILIKQEREELELLISEHCSFVHQIVILNKTYEFSSAICIHK